MVWPDLAVDCHDWSLLINLTDRADLAEFRRKKSHIRGEHRCDRMVVSRLIPRSVVRVEGRCRVLDWLIDDNSGRFDVDIDHRCRRDVSQVRHQSVADIQHRVSTSTGGQTRRGTAAVALGERRRARGDLKPLDNRLRPAPAQPSRPATATTSPGRASRAVTASRP